jgi:formylglycine-generating enzyme required for sulfatase activity
LWLKELKEASQREASEERLRELLASGVSPCVPLLTNSIGMQFALIPPGTFTMGSPADEADQDEDEDQREVEITEAFYLGIHAVTQQQYQRVMADNPSYFAATGKERDEVKGSEMANA